MITLGTASATSSASPSAFFARWVDHSTWGEWSPDTEWVHLDGDPALGITGVIKPLGGPKTRFTISAFDPNHEYTDTSFLPGARLVFQHLVTSTAGGTTLKVLVEIGGPLARIWAAIMGKGFRESAQADLDRLVALVEASSAEPLGRKGPQLGAGSRAGSRSGAAS
jgi:Polyketide cyclase / dehydrase and lipid transport